MNPDPRRDLVRPLLVALLTLGLSAAAVPAETPDAQNGVPALSAMHEVVYPLWHDAWPAKNLARIKELLPDVQKHFAALEAAKLPAMLHEKQATWDAGVTALAGTVAAMEKAVAAEETTAALDAVEQFHAGYEGLVRLLRPVSRELDAYHQTLYELYHHAAPAGDLTAVGRYAGDLVSRCAALQAAPLPGKAAGREDKVSAAYGALCAATAELSQATAGADRGAIDSAVERVHARYEEAAALLE